MSLIAKVSNFVLPPVGNHIGICCGVVHLGVVEREFEGHKKMQDKIMLFFELPNTSHVFKEENGPEPFVVSQEYTFSMGMNKGKPSNLRKMLEGWRGEPFSADDAKKFDILTLLTAPCQLNLVKKTSKNGKDRIEIYSVSQVMDGVQIPAMKTVPYAFTYPDTTKGEQFNTEVFSKLPSWIQEEIKKSEQYRNLSGGNIVAPGQTGQVQNPVNTTSAKKLPF